MLREYLKIFWYKTLKNKVITMINIAGLSIGIAVFTIIMLWVINEFSYDRFNKNLDHIYRVEIAESVYMVSAAAQTFKNEFPEIEKAVRFSAGGKTLLTAGEKSVYINNYILADSTVFDIFSFDFIEGNPEEALKTPFSIVLTENASVTLFGNTDPVGKTIKVNNRYEAVVTGIIKNISRTHMPVDALGSFVTLGKLNSQPDYLHSFGTWQYPTYFLISQGTDADDLGRRMSEFTNSLFSKISGKPVDESQTRTILVPLKDVYFHQPFFPLHLHGNLRFVYIFLMISVVTLLIACINFINLTIARSELVTKEIGVKKAFGASRFQVFSQLLLESVLICIVSGFLAVALVKMFLPEFNNITGGSLSLEKYLGPFHIMIYLMVVITIGLLAGIYPATRLSAVSPVLCFRKTSFASGRSFFRTGLVIFQFTTSVILVISVSVVIRQLNFMKKFETGFNDENVITLRLSGEIGSKQQSFRNDVLAIPGVRDIAFSSAVPGETNNFEGFEYDGRRYSMPVFTVDPSFLPLLDIKVSEGRNFSWDRTNDHYGACILNREAVKLWGIDEPVGKILRHTFYLTTIPKNEIEIIGVIDDYHYRSPRDSVGPALFCYGDWYGRASIKADRTNLPATLSGIEKIWTKYAPGFPFSYMFLEDSYGTQYRNESILNRILIYFALIGIFIGCLGLLGLMSFLTRERTKEIGVRKVFGSTALAVIRILSASFLRWVLIAVCAGIPVAIVIMNKWLSNFANHTRIAWWLVALGAIIIITISFFTVLFHIIRVSRTNPVNALRYE